MATLARQAETIQALAKQLHLASWEVESLLSITSRSTSTERSNVMILLEEYLGCQESLQTLLQAFVLLAAEPLTMQNAWRRTAITVRLLLSLCSWRKRQWSPRPLLLKADDGNDNDDDETATFPSMSSLQAIIRRDAQLLLLSNSSKDDVRVSDRDEMEPKTGSFFEWLPSIIVCILLAPVSSFEETLDMAASTGDQQVLQEVIDCEKLFVAIRRLLSIEDSIASTHKSLQSLTRLALFGSSFASSSAASPASASASSPMKGTMPAASTTPKSSSKQKNSSRWQQQQQISSPQQRNQRWLEDLDDPYSLYPTLYIPVGAISSGRNRLKPPTEDLVWFDEEARPYYNMIENELVALLAANSSSSDFLAVEQEFPLPACLLSLVDKHLQHQQQLLQQEWRPASPQSSPFSGSSSRVHMRNGSGSNNTGSEFFSKSLPSTPTAAASASSSSSYSYSYSSSASASASSLLPSSRVLFSQSLPLNRGHNDYQQQRFSDMESSAPSSPLAHRAVEQKTLSASFPSPSSSSSSSSSSSLPPVIALNPKAGTTIVALAAKQEEQEERLASADSNDQNGAAAASKNNAREKSTMLAAPAPAPAPSPAPASLSKLQEKEHSPTRKIYSSSSSSVKPPLVLSKSWSSGDTENGAGAATSMVAPPPATNESKARPLPHVQYNVVGEGSFLALSHEYELALSRSKSPSPPSTLTSPITTNENTAVVVSLPHHNTAVDFDLLLDGQAQVHVDDDSRISRQEIHQQQQQQQLQRRPATADGKYRGEHEKRSVHWGDDADSQLIFPSSSSSSSPNPNPSFATASPHASALQIAPSSNSSINNNKSNSNTSNKADEWEKVLAKAGIIQIVFDVADRAASVSHSRRRARLLMLRHGAAIKIQKHFRRWRELFLKVRQRLALEKRRRKAWASLYIWARAVLSALTIHRFLIARKRRRHSIHSSDLAAALEKNSGLAKMAHQKTGAFRRLRASGYHLQYVVQQYIIQLRHLLKKEARKIKSVSFGGIAQLIMARISLRKVALRYFVVLKMRVERRHKHLKKRLAWFIYKALMKARIEWRALKSKSICVIQAVARGMLSRHRVHRMVLAGSRIIQFFRQRKQFRELRSQLRRVERPLKIILRGIRNLPLHYVGKNVHIRTSVYWSPKLHLVKASAIHTVHTGKQPQYLAMSKGSPIIEQVRHAPTKPPMSQQHASSSSLSLKIPLPSIMATQRGGTTSNEQTGTDDKKDEDDDDSSSDSSSSSEVDEEIGTPSKKIARVKKALSVTSEKSSAQGEGGEGGLESLPSGLEPLQITSNNSLELVDAVASPPKSSTTTSSPAHSPQQRSTLSSLIRPSMMLSNLLTAIKSNTSSGGSEGTEDDESTNPPSPVLRTNTKSLLSRTTQLRNTMMAGFENLGGNIASRLVLGRQKRANLPVETIKPLYGCCSLNDEFIRVPGCHGNSVIKMEILIDDVKIGAYNFSCTEDNNLLFWGDSYSKTIPSLFARTVKRASINLNRNAISALASGLDAETIKNMGSLHQGTPDPNLARHGSSLWHRARDSVISKKEEVETMLEFEMLAGPPLRSRSQWVYLSYQTRRHPLLNAVVGLTTSWRKFYLCLDGDGLHLYQTRYTNDPTRSIPISEFMHVKVSKARVKVGQSMLQEDSCDVVLLLESNEDIYMRFPDSLSRISWTLVLGNAIKRYHSQMSKMSRSTAFSLANLNNVFRPTFASSPSAKERGGGGDASLASALEGSSPQEGGAGGIKDGEDEAANNKFEPKLIIASSQIEAAINSASSSAGVPRRTDVIEAKSFSLSDSLGLNKSKEKKQKATWKGEHAKIILAHIGENKEGGGEKAKGKEDQDDDEEEEEE